MERNKKISIWIFPVILAAISIGCGLSGAGTDSQPTPTRRVAEMLPTFTPTPDLVLIQPTPTTEIQVVAENPTSEPTTEPTEEPAAAPTEEPTPEDDTVRITVSQNMNVRGGPGTNYLIIGTAPPGASSIVTGRNNDNSWLQVQYPPNSSDLGWIYAQLVDVGGNLETIPVAQAPPPPPTPVPVPTPVPQPTAVQYQFTPAAWSTIGNEGIVHFRGTIRDPGGNAVSGYSVLLDNGAWSVLSHPTSASHHYPETVDGQWDVVIPNVGTGVGWWWLTVVRYDCPGFETNFDAQCKQFTRLSEDVKIMVNWPDETVVWADWTCNWDCDKGIYNVPYRRP